MRGLFSLLSTLYTVVLLVLLGALEFVGDRLALLGTLLFAPPILLLAPLALLIPGCLLLRQWRWCAVHCALAGATLLLYQTFHLNFPARPDKGDVTIASMNLGQANRALFFDQVSRERPEIVLMQDAFLRRDSLEKAFPDHHLSQLGEFVVASRHLITAQAPLKLNRRGRPIGARYELLVHGQRVCIYNVHLPTPRAQLARVLSGAALKEALEGEPPPDRRRRPASYEEWEKAHLELGQGLFEQAAQENLPTILAGDFNMPDHGAGYHRLSGEFQDVFARGGWGWGMTFPGDSGGLSRLLAPWLRIDYVFASHQWRVKSCETRACGRSQHLGLAARLRLEQPK